MWLSRLASLDARKRSSIEAPWRLATSPDRDRIETNNITLIKRSLSEPLHGARVPIEGPGPRVRFVLPYLILLCPSPPNSRMSLNLWHVLMNVCASPLLVRACASGASEFGLHHRRILQRSYLPPSALGIFYNSRAKRRRSGNAISVLLVPG